MLEVINVVLYIRLYVVVCDIWYWILCLCCLSLIIIVNREGKEGREGRGREDIMVICVFVYVIVLCNYYMGWINGNKEIELTVNG